MLGISFNPRLTHATRAFTLGMIGQDDEGNLWRFFCATNDVHLYGAVEFEADGDGAHTDAASGNKFGKPVGVAQVAINSGEYGWAMVEGTGRVNVKSAVTAFTQLYDHATDGHLQDSSTTNAKTIAGIVTTVTRSGGDGDAPCTITWPRFTS